MSIERCSNCPAWRQTDGRYTSPENRKRDIEEWAWTHESGRCVGSDGERWDLTIADAVRLSVHGVDVEVSADHRPKEPAESL